MEFKLNNLNNAHSPRPPLRAGAGRGLRQVKGGLLYRQKNRICPRRTKKKRMVILQSIVLLGTRAL